MKKKIMLNLVGFTVLSAMVVTPALAQQYYFRYPVHGVSASDSASGGDTTNPGDNLNGNEDGQTVDDYINDTEVESPEDSEANGDLGIGGIVVTAKYYDEGDYNSQEIMDLYNSLSRADANSFSNLVGYFIDNNIEYQVYSSGSITLSPGDTYLDENIGSVEYEWGTTYFGIDINYSSYDSNRSPKKMGRINIGTVSSWDGGVSGNVYHLGDLPTNHDRMYLGGQYSYFFDDDVHYFNFITVK